MEARAGIGAGMVDMAGDGQNRGQGMSVSKLNLERWTGKRGKSVEKMRVGQIVMRRCKAGTIRALEVRMRAMIRQGWEFSVGYGSGQHSGVYSIRRDK